MKLKKPSILMLTTLTCSLSSAQPTETLETIVVSSQNDEIAIQDQKVGETRIGTERIRRQQMSDSRDLVRYETGVTVVETGRFGASGYAVRGVDENRVGIMIDGLRQSETLSSQGFKELFEGYGNFNNTRNGVEIENVKVATITKGADSIKSGSGALGGSVMFETKDARDYLIDKNYHISVKRGYQTMNNQDLTSVTLAGRYKWFDALFIHTRREGHEIENYFYDIYKTQREDREAIGKTREKADPYDIVRESNLIKLSFQPHEEHRFTFALDKSNIHSQGEDLSYTLRSSFYINTEVYGQRKTNDKSKRENIQFSYDNFTQTPFWDHVKLTYSNQKITNNARTDEYCSGPKCLSVLNEQGLKLDNSSGVNKIVDQYGEDITAQKSRAGYRTIIKYYNSKGEEMPGTHYREHTPQSTLIDCSKIDCTKPFKVYVKKDENWQDVYDFKERKIDIKTLPNGQQYGQIQQKFIEKDQWGSTIKQYEESFFLLPFSSGYSRNDYNDRDLNTNTKQLDLDFGKEFSFWGTDHQLKYGGLYSKTEKSMVNKDGYQGGNVQWWADNFFCNQMKSGTWPVEYIPRPDYWPGGSCTGNLRENVNGRYSYLIPVKTKNQALYFGDKITLSNWLNVDLNYRYDKVEHIPRYDFNVPVPKGLIAGIFIPLPDNAYGIDAKCGYNTDCMNTNLAQNLAIMLKNKSYKHHSYNLGVNLDPLSFMRLQLKYSNGFRAPTSDEMFMTFKHPSFSIAPNVHLKSELAKTKEAALTFYRNNSFITLSAFQTDYKDFIDLVFVGERAVDVGSVLTYPFYQNQNRDKAKVTGFEVNSRLELSELHDRLKGFRVGLKLTQQKGKIDGKIPMNAIQPRTTVYNLGYSTEDDKYGIDFYITDVAAKKRHETYNMYWEGQAKNGTLVQGKAVKDSTLAWRNNHYTTLDAIAYARPLKNLLLTAGVYNITDKKYITWDSARSIRAIGTLNLIDQNTGAGIKRFYAPGRNFRLNAEFTF
ncbi:TPA: TonB-dependent hemoglobin/transferrin/lactoferrin family receptor [Pasteurella multocida]|uniref:TonB-dependent hemoglobin/transferrin/lactoferrin family receptor n=3 Tax=Pasteurella multocida TaxID=747 RepID=UPI0009F4CB65|nr:TonB-dependent hemoglobin/transferrin/lactoferrin family receptor [Pasteurella multocida]MCL7811932.1 TonB-dependent hemoglobin/transferrin/lactoferrin family receptor [Pasteurella multocida]PNM06175.1 TonB-dependent hemoglobin/transferrin/lactoferrin family receptor [Pasteurella multocida]HDR0736862.1 TonB-dependent hemoglobin/transferrin/lactoferrin family receptor [Pasteurella multocida]HDR0741591.1 TonB-dependent hemoglobin/transferrin/lactoferrin family receptor [Pasteurella multocida]